jgi:predicted nucleotidyltransferase
MGLREVLINLNELKAAGVIQDYAIGGGYAVGLYVQDMPTYDLDVFVVVLSDDAVNEWTVLSSVYEYYRSKGAKFEHEYVFIEGMPVQFLPNTISPLHDKAIEEAKVVEVEGVTTRFLSLEYLIAVLLTAYRPKDIIRSQALLKRADSVLVADIITEFDDESNTLHERYRQVLART